MRRTRNDIAERLRENPPTYPDMDRLAWLVLSVMCLFGGLFLGLEGLRFAACFGTGVLGIAWYGLRWYRYRLWVACSVIAEQDAKIAKLKGCP